MNLFDEANENVKAYEREFLTDKDTPVSTLQFPTIGLNPPLVVQCSHTKIDSDVVLGVGGLSDTTAIERCEFRSESVPQNMWSKFKKGMLCTLTINVPNAVQTFALQLWQGGLVEGGRTFRFMLVSQDYRG